MTATKLVLLQLSPFPSSLSPKTLLAIATAANGDNHKADDDDADCDAQLKV